MNDFFRKFANVTAIAVGSPWAFIIATLSVIIWAVSGPIFGFSDSWQLIINTGTTVATFLIVFLIQNLQNRDAKAIHLKLDELIRAVEGARTGLVDLEDLDDKDLARLQKQFERLHKRLGNGSIKIEDGQVEADEVKADEVKADRVEAKEIVTEQDDAEQGDEDNQEDDQQVESQQPAKRRRQR